MIGIVGALPREVGGLVRGVQADGELRRMGVFVYRLSGCVVVCGGMGTARVTLAVKAALEAGATGLVSVGLAGGCDPGLVAGRLVEAAEVVDALSGERYAGVPGAGTRGCWSTGARRCGRAVSLE